MKVQIESKEYHRRNKLLFIKDKIMFCLRTKFKLVLLKIMQFTNLN